MSEELVNIGINHAAYKVGKREILEWANDVLDSNLQDVAGNIGDAAAYCQLLHSVNRKAVNLKNVKFDAKDEYSYNINYQILQKAFKVLHIDKVIRPDALMRGKPLDNLEFIQWLKHYCTHVAGVEGYSGMAEREKYHPNLGKKDKRWAGSGKASSGDGGALKNSAHNNKPAGATRVAVKKPAAKRAPDSGASVREIQQLKTQVAEKVEEVQDLQLNVDALEKERDFYFGKLRDIEILCQEREGDDMPEDLSTLIETIKKIMYATDDADDTAEVVGDEVENDESY
jgi:RP/EB family microtubule-associated protein